nr:hypothetical protein [uncultured Niameybacter sp.]
MPTNFDPKDVEANKVYGILAYLSFLVIVPILLAKESAYAKFHANQGLTLFIVQAGISIGGKILMTILGLFTMVPIVGWIFGIIATIIGIIIWLLGIAVLVFTIMGIINAVKGEAKELPIIGKFQLLK